MKGDGNMDKEKVAHDLAILYELILAINPEAIGTPQDLRANYENSYKEYLEMLSE